MYTTIVRPKIKMKITKSNTVIESIKITLEQLSRLKSELEKSSITSNGKNDIIRKYAGGVCSICGNVPSKIVTHDANGAKIIERYCDKCFDRMKE